jgi:hypothetical protein
VTAEGFRELRLSCVTSQRDTAALLGVCVRTVRNWESRRRRVPYAAYRLLRILRNGELPGAAWAGYRLWGDTLWTPEGIALKAGQAAWWSLLVRCARAFQQQQRVTRLSAGDGEQPPATIGDGPTATDGRLASRSDSPSEPVGDAVEAVRIARQPDVILQNCLTENRQADQGQQAQPAPLALAGLVSSSVTSVLGMGAKPRVTASSEVHRVG